MALASGTRLGAYEILALIGTGGMGRVYRARDTKLDREVAIKVLPEEFASDSERLARFEREAKLLASLNHPNIASIHGFEEPNALVLELVEGPTLAERIEQGPIPIDEAIAIAKQIADALEAGHEAGVIHRDLKPANIKLKEDGTVKVLDYGLAKALEAETPSGVSSELSQSPTLTRQGTQTGVILGTASYMSPEQAKGKRVDRRADIWAFGAVLYEMLTGKRAFEGEDVSDTLAAVLRADPDLEAVPADTPASLRLVLRLCLNKDVTERLQSIGDVRLALGGAFETTAAAQESVVPPGGWRPSRALAGALVLAGVVGVASWNLKPETPRPVARSSLPLPPGVSLTGTGRHAVALSPDGTHLVYSANSQLYLRAMDQMEATPVRGTEGGARSPFFSPDGEWIAFWVDGQLKKVSVHGGAAVSLCEAENPFGARWEADDTIVFGQGDAILRVSAQGGMPEVLVAVDSTKEYAHGPQILRKGRDLLFTLSDGFNWDEAQIVVQSLETGERKVLIEGGRDARYVPTGHLIYVLEGTLLAVPFDVDALDVTGGPTPMAEDVETAFQVTGAAHFSVSDTGALVYVYSGGEAPSQLVWVNRAGDEAPLMRVERGYHTVSISPDGKAAVADDQVGGSIWVHDLERGIRTLVERRPVVHTAIWHPSSDAVVFGDPSGIYIKRADGSGEPQRILDRGGTPRSYSPDGNLLAFRDQGNIWIGDADGEITAFLQTEAFEHAPEFSPDGRFLAYISDVSGRKEIYVRPYPGPGERVLVSTNGGTEPVWSPAGDELFYRESTAVMAVPIMLGETIEVGRAERLFDGPYQLDNQGHANFDVTPDGERFLMLRRDAGQLEIRVVQNWFEELKRMVPAQ